MLAALLIGGAITAIIGGAAGLISHNQAIAAADADLAAVKTEQAITDRNKKLKDTQATAAETKATEHLAERFGTKDPVTGEVTGGIERTQLDELHTQQTKEIKNLLTEATETHAQTVTEIQNAMTEATEFHAGQIGDIKNILTEVTEAHSLRTDVLSTQAGDLKETYNLQTTHLGETRTQSLGNIQGILEEGIGATADSTRQNQIALGRQASDLAVQSEAARGAQALAQAGSGVRAGSGSAQAAQLSLEDQIQNAEERIGEDVSEENYLMDQQIGRLESEAGREEADVQTRFDQATEGLDLRFDQDIDEVDLLQEAADLSLTQGTRAAEIATKKAGTQLTATQRRGETALTGAGTLLGQAEARGELAQESLDLSRDQATEDIDLALSQGSEDIQFDFETVMENIGADAQDSIDRLGDQSSWITDQLEFGKSFAGYFAATAGGAVGAAPAGMEMGGQIQAARTFA